MAVYAREYMRLYDRFRCWLLFSKSEKGDASYPRINHLTWRIGGVSNQQYVLLDDLTHSPRDYFKERMLCFDDMFSSLGIGSERAEVSYQMGVDAVDKEGEEGIDLWFSTDQLGLKTLKCSAEDVLGGPEDVVLFQLKLRRREDQ